MSKYILEGKIPKKEDDLMAWAKWFEDGKNRNVKQDMIRGVHISTVFIGLDHSFGDSPPLLFETMIFGCECLSGYQRRYSTWEEAEAGHQAACELVVEEGLKKQEV